MKLPFAEIAALARSTYPNECCGLVLADPAGALRFVPIDNVAGASDASARSKRDGYVMDPKQLFDALESAERSGGRLHAIVHSHPDAGAYFSAEDKAKALAEPGLPWYPGVQYLVVSVRNGQVAEARMFSWDDSRADFIGTDLAEMV
jgi:proteasome lid subunit RPN8/RPN11